MPQTIDDYGSYNIPGGDSSFLKIETGENRLRLCSKPTELISHQTSAEGAKFATTPCQGENCELCKQGKKKNYKYAYIVLNRKDGKVYLYEAPITVFRQIAAYATNEEYGDPQEYDITIKREGEKPNVTYTVMASPKKAKLTTEEQELVFATEISVDKAYAGRA